MADAYQSVVDILGAQGPFSEHLPGFSPRVQQQALAQAVDAVLLEGGVLIGEAGTGVGKTFAYLVPAITSGLKVIISTGTRHLQDQLFFNDLPLVRRALQSDVKVALLKGRGNYLCKHRLAQASGHPALVCTEALSHQLSVVQHWAARTKTGDINEVKALPEDAPIWRYVTSDLDFCATHESDQLDGCFVYQARKRAHAVDIVVINHHLLFADLSLKEDGYGDLLPSANAFILDEAHQIPEVASQFFGKRISSRQLTGLVRDSTAEQMRDAADMSELREAMTALEKASRVFRLTLGVQERRRAWRQIADRQAVSDSLAQLHNAYIELASQLELAAPRSKGLAACLRRCEAQMEVLERFIEPDEQAVHIRWFETFRTGYVLSLTPLDVGGPFQRAVDPLGAAWLLTSATLSVRGSFTHFRRQLSIETAVEYRQDSPFDYRHNALLYLPPHMPEPGTESYDRKVIESALPVIRASGGRAFLLFTSHRALSYAAEHLSDLTGFSVTGAG